ncbi:MAG: nitroreductase family protein [Oscillospiraceae bacterium]|jgi:nitroreductase|nr:nitroreductase family protein [Oscillospiraceae bacterium]
MTVKEAIGGRRSIRTYKPEAVSEELLLQVLEAGRLSPSAANEQNWRFILARDADVKEKLFHASHDQPSVNEAPAAIVVCATSSREMSCGEQTGVVDGSCAIISMLLQAHELGLGTCWLGHFDADAVRAALGIPAEVEVVGFFPIGYPAEAPEARPRKDFAEVVSFDKY